MRALDLVIVGGGLAGGLCALALRRRRPNIRLLLVEPDERIGGNHLWSFFASDVAPAHRWLTDPLIGHRWPGYEVRFPAHQRHLDQTYQTIESEALDAAVRAALEPDEILAASVRNLGPTHVVLDSGERIDAAAVLDARGGKAEGLELGWQKFVGQLLTIPQGHGLADPIVMDATVEQHDGYRFVYCLPFSPTRLFVEDTYYSDGPEIDHDQLRDRIGDYAAAQGWQVAERTREEHGALPVVTGGDFDKLWPRADPVARAGARGGFFHPLTSYSLPDAVRFAIWLAGKAPLDVRLGAATRARARKHWKKGAFYRLLTALLFHAAAPHDRYRVLERFYRLSGPLIARFYAGTSTGLDKARVLFGKPPVPFFRALRVLKDSL
ncbi:lycopene beta-cyclase CrtY [Sphingomonas glaciei]|uniref:Lycopene beta-cyclase CrtY n=1 Tax=Sphingomonas glaciei TaxID=2938948 RepID=A0ABY5MUA9_9SPHN|nr:lycopene beta-cyclase CrtY [Sphingomonas glaciei]UUR08080.1 lycopene beta-cyclase CrtY [Sphingomonas glaciei]